MRDTPEQILVRRYIQSVFNHVVTRDSDVTSEELGGATLLYQALRLGIHTVPGLYERINYELANKLNTNENSNQTIDPQTH